MVYLQLCQKRFNYQQNNLAKLDKYFNKTTKEWQSEELDKLVNESAIYFDILHFFNIPLRESKKYTIMQLIVFRKQIERLEKEQTTIQANAIGLAFGGDKTKGGET